LRFWDSSALIPLLIDEPTSVAAKRLYAADPSVAAWWAARIECLSGFTRREREGRLKAADVVEGLSRLSALAEQWQEIDPAEIVRTTAGRLLRMHPLRAADAFQLAAAIIAADGDTRSLPFVTLDERLARAAEREGFPVLEPA
jgi:predicted nucleic acid-binding protein